MINIDTIVKKITRGAVLVAGHKYGGCYWITALGEAMVKIEQNEVIVENKKFSTLLREAVITGDIGDAFNIEYYKGKQLPGNIHIVEQLEPPIPEEPEELLMWKDDKVVRDPEGNAVWRYTYYTPSEIWDKSGDIDTLIV